MKSARADVGEQLAAADDDQVVGGQRHLAHQVAGDEDRAARRRPAYCMKLRIQRMPSGSSPLTGSSNISTCGSPSIAAAMPEALGHAEREALDPLAGHLAHARHVEHLVHPLGRQAVGLGQRQQVAAGRTRRRGRPWRPAARRPRASALAQVRVAAAVDQRPRRASAGRGRGSSAWSSTCPRRSGPRNPVTMPGCTVKREVVHGELVAVPLGEAPSLDHATLPVLSVEPDLSAAGASPRRYEPHRRAARARTPRCHSRR